MSVGKCEKATCGQYAWGELLILTVVPASLCTKCQRLLFTPEGDALAKELRDARTVVKLAEGGANDALWAAIRASDEVVMRARSWALTWLAQP